MSFKFECPLCGKSVEAQDEWRGMEAECPECKGKIVIPALETSKPKLKLRREEPSENPVKEEQVKIEVVCPQCGTKNVIDKSQIGTTVTCDGCAEDFTARESEEKICPYCGKSIKIKAKICKYCKKDLTTEGGMKDIVPPVLEEKGKTEKVKSADAKKQSPKTEEVKSADVKKTESKTEEVKSADAKKQEEKKDDEKMPGCAVVILLGIGALVCWLFWLFFRNFPRLSFWLLAPIVFFAATGALAKAHKVIYIVLCAVILFWGWKAHHSTPTYEISCVLEANGKSYTPPYTILISRHNPKIVKDFKRLKEKIKKLEMARQRSKSSQSANDAIAAIDANTENLSATLDFLDDTSKMQDGILKTANTDDSDIHEIVKNITSKEGYTFSLPSGTTYTLLALVNLDSGVIYWCRDIVAKGGGEKIVLTNDSECLFLQ